MSHSLEFFWVAQLDPLRVLSVSPACEEIGGRPCAELFANPWSFLDFIHPDDREAVGRASETNPSRFTWEARVVRPDGTLCWVSCRSFPLVNEAGVVDRCAGILEDITEWKLAEQSPRKNAEHFQLLIEMAPSVILVLDLTGRVVEWNQAAEQLFGCRRAEVRGVDYFESFLPAEVRETVRADWNQVLTGEPTRNYETPTIARHGSITLVWWNVSALRNVAGEVVSLLAVGQDVTTRKHLESRIQQAQKMESLGTLAGGIAHDFNNLLTGVLGNASLALMDLPAEAPARVWIEQIEKNALRAAELTRQMLAYSGRSPLTLQPIDLGRVVEGMLHLLQSAVSKAVVFRYDAPAVLPLLQGDAAQLRQVIVNLVTNASDAIGERSGIVQLRIGVQEADEKYLESAYIEGSLPAGPYVFLEVSDTGCGMDDATRGKIFDPFFTTKFTGRGLGLAAVLGIVRAHQGTIKVYSELGKGSMIKVLLPALPGPEEPRKSAETEWRPSGTILVVDDEELVRQFVRATLERTGFRVMLASDGVEGVALYREHASHLSAVLLDLIMPNSDGEQVYRELRLLDVRVPVLIMSGFAEEEVTNRFTGKGLAGSLQKPFRPVDLLTALRKALERQPAAPPVE